MNRYFKIENTPLALSGIALGLTSLSILWDAHGIKYVKAAAVCVSLVVLCLVFIKILLNPKKLLNELEDPAIGSLSFTVPMLIMLLSSVIKSEYRTLALCIWLCGIILYLINLILFMILSSSIFKFENVLPSWFTPAVGICLVVTTGKQYNFDVFYEIVFFYSLTWLLLLLPIIVYRTLYYKPRLKKSQVMTLAVFAAPANLCLAAYLDLFKTGGILFILLLGISHLLTSFVYILLPYLLSRPFTYSFAALTFPLSIGAVASNKLLKILIKFNSSWVFAYQIVFYMQLMVATIVVGYVIYKTIEQGVKSGVESINRSIKNEMGQY